MYEKVCIFLAGIAEGKKLLGRLMYRSVWDDNIKKDLK